MGEPISESESIAARLAILKKLEQELSNGRLISGAYAQFLTVLDNMNIVEIEVHPSSTPGGYFGKDIEIVIRGHAKTPWP